MTRARFALIGTLAFAAGCTCSRDPYAGSLSDNVGATFADCNEAEIKFLAAKHNVQLAFGPCGSNNFSAFQWSPDGLQIYFQLVMAANVMNADADDKRTQTLPIPQPTGTPTWMTPTRLVIPVVGESDAPQMAVFDLPDPNAEAGAVTGQLTLHPLPGLTDADALQRGDGPTDVLFLGTADGETTPRVFRFDTAEGTHTQAFPWAAAPVDTMTYTPDHHALLLGKGDVVTWHDSRTGEVVRTLPHARRASLNPEGTWLALELPGQAVSVFDQRTWDEVSDQARRREEARAEAFAERLPDAYERKVRPPTLSFMPADGDDRWAITAFQGDGFQWYGAAEGWGSFFLWGFESKQYKRNVALVNLNGHLSSMEQGAERYGVVAFSVPGDDAPAPNTDAKRD